MLCILKTLLRPARKALRVLMEQLALKAHKVLMAHKAPPVRGHPLDDPHDDPDHDE